MNPPLAITNLRGGLNDSDTPLELDEDQCTQAMNVEWYEAPLGVRRKGCGTIPITGVSLSEGVIHIAQWFPTNDPSGAALFVVGVETTSALGSSVVARSISGVWSAVTQVDAIDTTNSASSKYPSIGGTPFPDFYAFQTQDLNGRLFLAYHNSTDLDRLHLWNGTAWRRTGLAQPAAAPTAADSGGAGTIAGVRYYRVRYIEKSGSTILRRGEPSAVLTFTPSGANLSITITKPAAISESETHWELEASTDNANFYILATTLVATTTVVDTTVFITGYAGGVLSEAIGDYLLQPSAKFLAIDGDRLLMAGHWSDTTLQSTIWWTPVKNDPGVGNDERLPLNSRFNNRLSLDNYTNGPITGISDAINGSWYVFKWSSIYKLSRTGQLLRAYSVTTISMVRGAIPGSIIMGLDEHGNPCIYFLDPSVGPCRLGTAGLQLITGLRTTWARVNISARYVVARGLYYPLKDQVHWWVATDGANTPNLKLILQVSELRMATGGVGRGWSLANGKLAQALCACMVYEYGLTNSPNDLRPYVGFDQLVESAMLLRSDIGTTDNGTAYTAAITTRPYVLNTIMQHWGVLVGALATSVQLLQSLVVSLVRDFGKETVSATTALTTTGSEDPLVTVLDQLAITEAHVVQITISDP